MKRYLPQAARTSNSTPFFCIVVSIHMWAKVAKGLIGVTADSDRPLQDVSMTIGYSRLERICSMH